MERAVVSPAPAGTEPAAGGPGFAVAGGTGHPRHDEPGRIPWSGWSPFPPLRA